MNLNDDGADRRTGFVGGLGNLGSQSLFLNGRDCNHENDDEHQEYINHGREIHFGSKRTTACC